MTRSTLPARRVQAGGIRTAGFVGALALVWFVALPLLVISILLAVALLVWSVVGSDS